MILSAIEEYDPEIDEGAFPTDDFEL
jgi:hypothetical protein